MYDIFKNSLDHSKQTNRDLSFIWKNNISFLKTEPSKLKLEFKGKNHEIQPYSQYLVPNNCL
jgi:hypothetical protein